MIPAALMKLIDKQEFKILRADKTDARQALTELNVPLVCEFSEFLLTYDLNGFFAEHPASTVIDVISPTRRIAMATQFIHEVWEIPENYLCITNCEGEGCYLYDLVSEAVIDFELATRVDFLEGNFLKKWTKFYEFFTWYLSDPLLS